MKEFAEYLVRESSKYVSWQAAPKSGLICNFDEMGFWKVEKRDKISRENKHIQGRKGRKQKSRQVSLRNWDDSDWLHKWNDVKNVETGRSGIWDIETNLVFWPDVIILCEYGRWQVVPTSCVTCNSAGSDFGRVSHSDRSDKWTHVKEVELCVAWISDIEIHPVLWQDLWRVRVPRHNFSSFLGPSKPFGFFFACHHYVACSDGNEMDTLPEIVSVSRVIGEPQIAQLVWMWVLLMTEDWISTFPRAKCRTVRRQISLHGRRSVCNWHRKYSTGIFCWLMLLSNLVMP